MNEFNVGDLVEVTVIKNIPWSIIVKLPNNHFCWLHPLKVANGPKGRPELGELLYAVVEVIERGSLKLSCLKSDLIKYGYRYSDGSLDRNSGQKFHPRQTKPEEFAQDSFFQLSTFKIGEKVEVTLDNFLTVGMIIIMPDGRKNWIHPDDYDRGPNGEKPILEVGEKFNVIILDNRNDGRPYLGVKTEYFDKFGHNSNQFRFQ